MRNPTIDDVAQHAGVSKATVSAVLNDADSVKESTRQKVLASIEHLNYRPRSSARRRFKPGQGKSIGFVIKEFSNPYFAGVIVGARSYANEHGYSLLVASSEGNCRHEQRLVNLLKSKDCDGLIIFPVLDDETDLSYLFDLKRRNYPFVMMEEIRGVQASLIDVDNVAAMQKATQYLIELGHTKIVHFAGPEYSTHSQRRIEGVRRAFSETRLVFSSDLVVPAGAHQQDGYRAGLAYFKEIETADRPTAVVCYNDLVALGVIHALHEQGLRVPEDVSVVGCDDIDLLEYVSPPLTTLRIPRFEKGRLAAEVLIRHIESREKLPPEKIAMEAELVVRGTTRPLGKRRSTGRTLVSRT